MTLLLNWQDGITTLLAQWANGVDQTCQSIAQLRAFNGNGGAQQVSVQGQSVPGDGGQGTFYWNASASGVTDDNYSTIVPSGSLIGCWSRLTGPGGIVTTETITSGASTSIAPTLQTLFVNVSNAFSVNLPSSPFTGETHTIKDTSGDASVYNITVVGSIDGASSYVINTNYGYVTVQFNGTSWSVVDQSLSASSSTLEGTQVQLTYSGGNLLLSPYGGNKLTIGTSLVTVPSSGVTLGPAGLTASTLYYIYAYLNAGVLTLQASTTTHSLNAATGLQTMFGNTAYTFVGWAYVVSGPAFASNAAQQLVVSHYNRRTLPLSGTITSASVTTTVTSEVSTASRAAFISTGDESIVTTCSGTVANTVGGAGNTINVGIDGSGIGIGGDQASPSSGSPFITIVASYAGILSEGYHFATPMASVTSGTGGFNIGIVGSIVG